MRLNRRTALLLGAGASAGAVAAAFGHRAMARVRGADEPVAIRIEGRPIAAFDPRAPGDTRFGALTFRSGLVLTSRFEGFGRFSGLWRSPDGGAELVALTDNGMWLTARTVTEAGRIVGLAEARMAPILGLAGESLRHTRAYDTE
ncbi:MAG: twin-arginine translocation pathway signal, partial [Methylobacteriaceae bacterium]|nr:twin-arginine translocation pathway signal [Methylobacteriaceae bacterium]